MRSVTLAPVSVYFTIAPFDDRWPDHHDIYLDMTAARVFLNRADGETDAELRIRIRERFE